MSTSRSKMWCCALLAPAALAAGTSQAQGTRNGYPDKPYGSSCVRARRRHGYRRPRAGAEAERALQASVVVDTRAAAAAR